MVNLKIFIDTQLWVFALKIPSEKHFLSKTEFKDALNNYKITSNFLKNKLENDEICMTNLQLGELFHALGFRGKKLPLEYVQDYCNSLLTGDFMHWYDINNDVLQKAITLSNSSKIHIWDYLCILPLYKDINVIFSCDQHFTDETFRSLGPPIENPIKNWYLL